MGVIAEGILRGCQGLFIPVSLGYPPSVFTKKLYSQRKGNWSWSPPFPRGISSPPLAAVLIAPKGAKSSDSGRMRVIGALVHCFPSETVWDKLHSP